MKTIQQQVTVKFHAVEVQDIITMLPVYDRLIKEFKGLCDQFDKEFSKSTDNSAINESYLSDLANEAVKRYDQIKCLDKLGFMSSIQVSLEKHEALTIAYHCGPMNEVRDLMANGITPIDALAEFDIL